MSEPAPLAPPAHVVRPDTTWPHQLSHQPTLRVGDVIAALRPDFPSLSASKLRFLDAQGLVAPGRTDAGYRQYSHSDVERLRFVLRQQRDAYAPLSVILERLEALDEGRSYEALSLAIADSEGDVVSVDEAATLADTEPETVMVLVQEGIVRCVAPGQCERSSVQLIAASARYLAAGADVRELRALARGAQREVDAALAAAGPMRRQDSAATAQAFADARVAAAGALFSAFLHRVDSVGE